MNTCQFLDDPEGYSDTLQMDDPDLTADIIGRYQDMIDDPESTYNFSNAEVLAYIYML